MSSSGGWVLGAATVPIESKYTLGKRVGEKGQYGFAQLCTHKETKELRAVKVIAKSRYTRNKSQLDRMREEYELMKELSHKNIITVYEAFESKTNFYIVMEYCAGGELFNRIQQKKRYSERDASLVLRQIVEGIHYLHENKVAHCDLKPDNFLFTTMSDDADLKIIDFGMSKHFQSRSYMRNVVGTMFYIAPEVFNQHYTYHCDMWSIGVVMFIMLFGFPPFHGQTDASTQRKIIHGFDPRVMAGYGAFFPAAIPVSESARDLMRRLMETDPALRLSAAECLEHPWLADPDSNDTTPLVASVLGNLAKFQAQFRFKNVVLAALSSALDEKDAADLRASFQALDLDGDGVITQDELRQAMANGNHSSQELQDTIATLMSLGDVDGDGKLSYDELVMASVAKKLAAKEDRLVNVFRALDVDGDGKLTAQEIGSALSGYLESTDDIAQMISEVDKDGDGCVDYEEFVAMFVAKESEETMATLTRT